MALLVNRHGQLLAPDTFVNTEEPVVLVVEEVRAKFKDDCVKCPDGSWISKYQ